MGVRTDEYFATYDATPKEEKIEFGRAYKLDAPEAGYETRVIALEIDVPRKPMTISLRIPTMIIESQSVESISFELKYTDKWEVLKLAP